MARRKFRHGSRFENGEVRSFTEYLATAPAPLTSRTELLRLINGGEDTFLELKVKLSNVETIAQTIVALANTAGGTIIFGVNDQMRVEGLINPEEVQDELVRICREEVYPPLIPVLDSIAFDSGKRVVAIDIEGKKRPYRTRDGRFYMRVGEEKREVSRDELSIWLDELRPLTYENIPFAGVKEEDFDDTLLWSFADAFEDDSLGRHTYNTREFLRRDLLMAAGNGEDFLPTAAAILLFGKNERVAEILPRASVTLARYSGDSAAPQVVEKTQVSGNMHYLMEVLMTFIGRYVDLDREKPKRKFNGDSPVAARKSYHQQSIREAVANLLCHRDLALRDVPTRILIYDTAIEFINPRRTLGFVPPASRAIRYGLTQRLNPQIAAVFSRREYGSNVPKGGLPMIIKKAMYFSGKRAEIYTANDEFKLKMYGA